jgi:hypothetical protein
LQATVTIKKNITVVRHYTLLQKEKRGQKMVCAYKKEQAVPNAIYEYGNF